MARWRGAVRTGTMLRCSGCALAMAAVLVSEAFSQQGPALPDAPAPQSMQATPQVTGQVATQNPAPKASGGQIAGTVVDGDKDIVPGAQVTLSIGGTLEVLKTASDENGNFHFTGVQAGKYTLTATYPGMSGGTFIGVLRAGETVETPALKLGASASDSVQVIATQEELAEAELHVEEHQRVMGIMPNFFTAYDWHAPPLTARQKFQLAWKNVIDPGSFFVTGVTAAIEYGQDDFSGYGRGLAGYARRYGASTGDLVSGTYLGGAILPSLFHQDPRYFYKGTGTIKSRAWYAITRAFICRGDNGKQQFGYAGILGDLASGALSNAYYPAANRAGAALTFENSGLNLLGDAIGNLVQEFALKHLTPHAPKYDAGTGSPSATAPPAGQP